MITQEDIYQAMRQRNDELIRVYFQGVRPKNVGEEQASVLGVALSWLSRAAQDVPQFRVWLENEMDIARNPAKETGPFDIETHGDWDGEGFSPAGALK